MVHLREALEVVAPMLCVVLLAVAVTGVPLHVEGLHRPPAPAFAPAMSTTPSAQELPSVCVPMLAAAMTPGALLPLPMSPCWSLCCYQPR